jgi:hypothetical protein
VPNEGPNRFTYESQEVWESCLKNECGALGSSFLPVIGAAPHDIRAIAMDALLVDGDEIELTPDPPWFWVEPMVTLSLMATPGHLIKAKGKFTIWKEEIVAAGLLAMGKQYLLPGFVTPGVVTLCSITVDPSTMSKVYKDAKQPIATVATSGTFTAVVTPAANPVGVLDAALPKTGTWKVVTEKQSVAKSGQPKEDEADGDDANAKAASASGSNSTGPSANENRVHWVGVKYQDIDGNPLPEHRIAISTPDGRRVERKTTAAGASRVDGVRVEGEATASLLEVSLRPGVKQPPVPFLGVTIVDEDGLPIEGVELGFTSPSGAELAGETNKKGSLRLDKLPELGLWKVRVTHIPEALGLGSVGTGIGDGAQPGGPGAGSSAGGSTEATGSESDQPMKRLYLLEVPDILCRTSSCVLAPKAEQSESATVEGPTLARIVAGALRFCQERPDFKALVAAHTDTVDTTDENQVLSKERAQMALAILIGDREAYKKLAHARHRISDIKAMLHWCITAYSDVFTCDPGPIDDTDNTWTPIHTFENEFNYYKHYFQASQTPDLVLSGSMGPNNWGALFDVLQFAIARELGVLVRDLAPVRDKIMWLDDERKALGFSEHHPIDAVDKDNYESQSNRRVELLFFDGNDILPDLVAAESDPANAEIYVPGGYTRQRVVRMRLRIRPLLAHAFTYKLSVSGADFSGDGAEGSSLDLELWASPGQGTLTVTDSVTAEEYVWTLQIGDVSPSSAVQGAQQRLINLGYLEGQASGTLDGATRDGLLRFQHNYGLVETGELDAATRSKLAEVHDY